MVVGDFGCFYMFSLMFVFGINVRSRLIIIVVSLMCNGLSICLMLFDELPNGGLAAICGMPKRMLDLSPLDVLIIMTNFGNESRSAKGKIETWWGKIETRWGSLFKQASIPNEQKYIFVLKMLAMLFQSTQNNHLWK